jgi:hypothetical protein
LRGEAVCRQLADIFSFFYFGACRAGSERHAVSCWGGRIVTAQ